MRASTTLKVPNLITLPVIASGCCATLTEDIITQELAAWPGVESVVVEQPSGTVTVSYDPGRIDVPAIRDALCGVDYPATGG